MKFALFHKTFPATGNAQLFPTPTFPEFAAVVNGGLLDVGKYGSTRKAGEEMLHREQEAREAEIKRKQEELEEAATRIAREEAEEYMRDREKERRLRADIERLKAESAQARAYIQQLREEEAARQDEIMRLQQREDDEIGALMALGML